jgi:ribosomal protein L22
MLMTLEIKELLEVLRYAAADAEARKELDEEEYYRKAMEGMFGKQNKK